MFWYFPLVHVVQPVATVESVTNEYVPAAQVEHFVALIVLEYVPDTHLVHASFPAELAGEKLPAVQSVQDVDPTPEKVPAGQVVQAVESKFAIFPAGH